MILYVLLFFLIYALILGFIITVGFIKQRSKERRYLEQSNKIDLSEVIVLIPFRNEAHRIKDLLESINRLHVYPKEFVFVDDHSSDETQSVIEGHLSKSLNYRVLTAPKGSEGKKKALRFGTTETSSTYILTIDADVRLNADYFSEIAALGDADMYVLPAIMEGNSISGVLYEVDLNLVNAANAGLAGVARPIMASGANLLYKRETFEVADNFESHAHMASGDDTYLLRDFREHRADVRLLTNPKCAIRTETPSSFKEFMDQRLRWIGKTGDLKDHLSTTLAVLQSVLTLLFFVLMIWQFATGEWKWLGVTFGLKAVVDLMIFYPFFARLKRWNAWFIIPLYEVLFPLYTLLILVLLLTYKPQWKDRPIYNINS